MNSPPYSKLPIPSGWHSDELSEFLHLAMHNVFATFNNKKKEYKNLEGIDALFQSIISNLLNTPEFLPAMLLLRAHSTYRAACRLALSGQVPETFVLLRSCIESSLYALHISKNQTSGDIWLSRHENETSLKKTKKEFTYANVIKTLEKSDRGICKKTRELYERTIDYGAHPNELAVSSSLKVIDNKDRREFKQLYLVGDTSQLDHGLISTAQVGLCSLYIFRDVFPERFEIIGVLDKMRQYRKTL